MTDMAPKVELIYDRDCPNVDEARAELKKAFDELGMAPKWMEWERGDPSSPPYVRRYGSPTILVEGKDVAGEIPAKDEASCCRVYGDPAGGLRRAPSAEMIARVLRTVGGKSGTDDDPSPRSRSVWGLSLPVLPALGASLLPVGTCPLCWPAYAGLLSALGLGVLLKGSYMLALTSFFFVIAVAALAYNARSRRGFGPFFVGLGAAGLVLVGKFLLPAPPLVYAGVGLLLVASAWNVWPRRSPGGDSCSACAAGGGATTAR